MATILFDTGGGAVLMTDTYCHSYDNMQQLAADAKSIMAGDDCATWEGNQPECRRDEHETDSVWVDGEWESGPFGRAADAFDGRMSPEYTVSAPGMSGFVKVVPCLDAARAKCAELLGVDEGDMEERECAGGRVCCYATEEAADADQDGAYAVSYAEVEAEK